MSHSTIDRPIDQAGSDVCTLDHADAYIPSAEDLADYASWLAGRDDLGHATERTPDEVLDASAELDGPRYEVRVCGNPTDPAGGYLVWDKALDRPLNWFRWFAQAADAVTDLIAEDWPDAGDWWVTAPPHEVLDGPRVKLV